MATKLCQRKTAWLDTLVNEFTRSTVTMRATSYQTSTHRSLWSSSSKNTSTHETYRYSVGMENQQTSMRSLNDIWWVIAIV